MGQHQGYSEVPRIQTNVLYVDLGYNDITTIPWHAFKPLQCVLINLNANRISDIASGAFNAPLRRLYLSNNDLSFLTRYMLAGLSNLEELYVNNNQIIRIERGALDDLTSLKVLKLHGNKMRQLSQELFKRIPKSLKLNITMSSPDDSHVWSCDALCWLRREELAGNITWWHGAKYAPRCESRAPWEAHCQGKYISQ